MKGWGPFAALGTGRKPRPARPWRAWAAAALAALFALAPGSAWFAGLSCCFSALAVAEAAEARPGVPPLDGDGGNREARHVMTKLGPVEYVDVLEMEASAYYPGPESTGVWADGITAAGLPAGYGVVAVDPEVIPLGTLLYISGYGLAIAGDVGSAIKGLKVDLGFDTYREALLFGRRSVQVYVVSERWVRAAGQSLFPSGWLAGWFGE